MVKRRKLLNWAGCFGLGTVLGSCRNAASNRIVIGSKNFTEQILLGEILAQYLEFHTSLKVDRRFNLGGTFICHQGITSGQLDLYVEYTGTAYTAILKQKAIADPTQVYQSLKQAYAQQFNLEWTEPLGFNNTFAMVVRGEDARRLNLQTLSQAAKYTPQWRLGVGNEFLDRPDGLPGLTKVYNLKFAQPPTTMDLGLIYQALTSKQVDMVAGAATDGPIASLGLVILQDDRRFFPPYQAAPIVRQQLLTQHPEVRSLLQALGGKFSEADMQRWNYEIDGKKRDIKDVAKEALKAKNLIKSS